MFKYNPQTNLLEEQASMEKPDFAKYNDHFLFYGPWREYEAHLSALRKYPVQPGTIWDEAKEYEEGKDFYLAFADEWKWTQELKGNVFAIPISQEDDLWKEVYDTANDVSESLFDIIMKSKFVITRKTDKA